MTSTDWTRIGTENLGDRALSLIHLGTEPEQFEAWLAEHIDDELSDCTAGDLRSMAEQYLRLREAIAMTMPDWLDWTSTDRQLTVAQLAAYIDHLTQAVRGRCAVCKRTIYAPHLVTRLPERGGWRRWWQAAIEIGRGFTEAWGVLRYGECRTVHTSCRPRF
jgi:hypothetical protein